jgi:hypothetical protein
MLTLNGTDYRCCLLDTNAVSEMVRRPEALGHFLTWSFSVQPFFIPCFSLFTVLELRRNAEVYRQFIARFGPLPCLLLKSHEQLLEEEIRCYPDPSAVDPYLLGFSGELGPDRNSLANALAASFGSQSILDQERHWNDGQEEIVKGISSLVANFPPEGDKYKRSEVRTFIEIAGFEQLVLRAGDFAEKMVMNREVVDIDALPSLKATLYTIFHKFYADRARRPSRSDAFDIIISAATPYVEAIFTENHQAESLRKTKRLDDFVRDLHVYTLKDFRGSSPASALLSSYG